MKGTGSSLPAEPTALDWMELHLLCLHHHDANGRLAGARQCGGGRSPLFHLGRTALGNLWRFRNDLDADAVRELARLTGREGPTPWAEPPPPPERLEAMRRVLERGGRSLVLWRGPAYRFPARIPEPPSPLPLREVRPGGEDVLIAEFADLAGEIGDRQPCVAALDRGQAVSVCFSSRPLEVAGSPRCAAAEAGVETVARHRGRGLAAAAVAAWARALRATGGEPLYSTSWDNRASRAVAGKLGLLPYGEDLHFS